MDKGRRDFLLLAGGALFGSAALLHRSSLALGTDAGACPQQKWALSIDIPRCIAHPGCTACRDACHLVHNVPNFDSVKEEIKWIWKEPYERVFRDQINPLINPFREGQLLPVLCNHCDNSPCTKVCPTKATWRREDGIVMMDMHRCIGCRYCMAACPYGSRSFNFSDPVPMVKNRDPNFPTRTKGVVEKCNLCEERLTEGKLPACVETCRKIECRAITLVDLTDKNDPHVGALSQRTVAVRRPELGTLPKVFYLL
jgi:molybdopterin-containing oxidoreductase family iron-sulfur binding subunit